MMAIRVRCSNGPCTYATKRTPRADYGVCPRCGSRLVESMSLEHYKARPHKGQTATSVKCYACGFLSRRIERADGTFGACSDCGEPMTRMRSWNEFVASGAAREQMAEANAARILRELHNPALKIRRVRRARAAIYARFGRNFFSRIASYPRRKKGQRKHERNISRRARTA